MLPGFERTDLIGEADRRRRTEGCGHKNLRRAHPHPEDGERHRQRQRCSRRRAGVEVRSQGNGNTRPQELTRRGERLAEDERRGGKKHRHCPSRSQSCYPVRGDVQEMLSGHGAESTRKLGRPDMGKLIGVDLQREPRAAGRDEDRPGLVDSVEALIAEHVAESSQAAVCDHRDHLLDEETHIVLPRHLRRERMGAHERGYERQGHLAAELPHHAEHLHLVHGGEPVPGLHLHGGDTQPEHAQEPGRREPNKLALRSLANSLNRGQDPAARVLVPPCTGDELLHSGACEHGVGVGIHEPGGHAPTLRIQRRPSESRTSSVPGLDDPSILDKHIRIPEDGWLALGLAMPRPCTERGGQLPDPVHEEVHGASIPSWFATARETPRLYWAAVIELDGHLTPMDAEAIILGRTPITLTQAARTKVEASHKALLAILARGEPVYGVNTGFGALSTVRIPEGDLAKLQRNIVLSHATGVGRPLPDAVVRGMLLFRLNSFLQGASGVRPEVVDLLIPMLNAQVHPVVPEQGSVGSSGDLVPLAHLALPLLGEGRARLGGKDLPSREALQRAGIAPLTELSPKEGLALLNGTACMLACLFLAWTQGWRSLRTGLAVAALSFQALRGRTEALDPRVHALRPHPGQIQVAAWLRELLSDSALSDSHTADVQDPYSLRCLPQLLGPVVETLWAVEGRLRVEMNAATDNPLILSEGRGTALAGGNFHGEILAFAAEWLGVALAELGASCERRLNALLTAEARGLPSFLAPQPGTSSGLMLLQYTAAALTAENKVLAHPAAVDSIPTSGGKEDHNAMGGTSAWKTLRIAENVLSQVALEAVAARWAVSLAGEEDISPASRPAYAGLCALVSPPGEDRFLGEEIERVRQAIREGGLDHHEL